MTSLMTTPPEQPVRWRSSTPSRQEEQLRKASASIAEYSAHQKRLEAEILAAQAPLMARLSKSTARRTYGLRRKLGLTRHR